MIAQLRILLNHPPSLHYGKNMGKLACPAPAPGRRNVRGENGAMTTSSISATAATSTQQPQEERARSGQPSETQTELVWIMG